jgi:hypothetical protein
MSNPILSIGNIGGVSMAEPIFTTHEGYSGGSHIKGYTINNPHNTHWFSNIYVKLNKIADVVDDPNNNTFHPKGWSIKLMKTPNDFPPTEEEWSVIFPNTELNLDSLGDADSPDVNTTIYFWVRVFCPGNTDPGFYDSEISINYNALLIDNSGQES